MTDSTPNHKFFLNFIIKKGIVNQKCRRQEQWMKDIERISFDFSTKIKTVVLESGLWKNYKSRKVMHFCDKEPEMAVSE